MLVFIICFVSFCYFENSGIDDSLLQKLLFKSGKNRFVKSVPRPSYSSRHKKFCVDKSDFKPT